MENFDILSNIRKVVACQDGEAVRIKKPVENNGSRMKYQTKNKHRICVETLAGKTTDKGKSFTLNRRKIQSIAQYRINPNVLILRKYTSRKVHTVKPTPQLPQQILYFSQLFSFNKSRTADLRIGHKPKINIQVTNQQSPS